MHRIGDDGRSRARPVGSRDRSAINETPADLGPGGPRRRPGPGAGGDLGGPLVRDAGRAGARLQRRDPRAVVRPGLAVRRVLRDPMAADPQLGGSRRAGGPGPGAPRLGRRPDHDQRDARRVRRGGLLAAAADLRARRRGRRRAAPAGGRAAGGAAGHEHHLAAGLHQLHAGCLPVPDHAGVLVAAPRPPGGPRRPRAVGAPDPGLLLSPGQPGTDRDGPGRAGAGDPAAAARIGRRRRGSRGDASARGWSRWRWRSCR